MCIRDSIRALPSFKGIERNLPLSTSTTAGLARLSAVNDKLGTQETIDYGRKKDQLTMLGVPELNDKGFRGQGMLIAMLDAGFSRANEMGYLKALYANKRVLETYDFISRNTNVYDDHFHGLNCLSTIAANQPGLMVGAAPEASFLLYRTENDFSETPYEEATWLSLIHICTSSWMRRRSLALFTATVTFRVITSAFGSKANPPATTRKCIASLIAALPFCWSMKPPAAWKVGRFY